MNVHPRPGKTLIRWQLESGSHGISLGGSTGEPSAQTTAERAAAIKAVAAEIDKARELHFGLHPVTDVIYTETNPAAAKWVLHRAGLIASAFVRPPLVPLTKGRPGDRTAPAQGGRASARRPCA